ncbi:hypothetical protein OKW76_10270 [Sphingomonas sp. S1-29]|uniref:hypothetical protein n=1 Tax=Sphingomonas sp. S1-29 TaxID=2991074 RepID=UPI00223FC98F|nr:hypothetical protein [Sphingomonas sp. S1-29]UZK68447.1 hypothetical protein OKW76_10270 [Sphingomonas sp. S1-29]
MRIVAQRDHRIEEPQGVCLGVLAGGLHLVDPSAVAHRIAIAQQEHRQPFVIIAPLADLFPLEEDRARDAVDRARGHRVRKLPDGMFERPAPCRAKAGRPGIAAQPIGGDSVHPHRFGGLGDAAGGGERFDELGLAIGGPAVASFAQRDRIEIGHGVRGIVGGRRWRRGRDGAARSWHGARQA